MSCVGLWEAPSDMRTGETMLWMKWKRAVRRRHRFLHSRVKRFSGSKLSDDKEKTVRYIQGDTRFCHQARKVKQKCPKIG